MLATFAIRLLLYVSCILFINSALARDYLVFAPLPIENREAVVSKAIPLANFLELSLKKPVLVQYYPNYAEIIHEFRAGAIDFAYLGPLPYTVLSAEYFAATPIVFFRESDGTDQYTCSLITPFDSELAKNNFDEVRHSSLSMTQPLSTCGELATTWMLRQRGVDIRTLQAHYTGTHEAVALQIVRTPQALGSLKTAIAKLYTHLGVKLLDETPPLPGFALIGNAQTLSPLQLSHTKSMLLGLAPAIYEKWPLGKYGFSSANVENYNNVLQLMGETGLDPQYFRRYID